jgi:hypothetical protein
MRTCPFPGCGATIPDTLFACRPHWFSLAKVHQHQIWRAYESYQSGTMDVEELRAVQQFILDEHFGKVAP